MSDYDEQELALGGMFEDETEQEQLTMPEMPIEASQMVDAFRAKHANAKFLSGQFPIQTAKDMSTPDLLDHLNDETSRHPNACSPSANAPDDEQLEDLHLSLATLPQSTNLNPDTEDWDIIDDRDLMFMDGASHPTFPTAIYQPPSFRVTFDEWVKRYTPSEEKQKTMRAAWTIMKWAGEFGYAVVSEPVFDAAESVVQSQFGTDLEGLPKELRRRAYRRLPEGVQRVVATADSDAEPSVGAAGSIYQRLRENTKTILSGRTWTSLLMRSTGATESRISDESLYAEAQQRSEEENMERMMPSIHNDLAEQMGEDPNEVAFIDELEGMNVGK